MTAQDPARTSKSSRPQTQTQTQPPEPAIPASPVDQAEPAAAQALHGYRNEVNWEGGSGRHPYGNQGRRETPGPAAGQHVPEGNRAGRSGTHQDQDQRSRAKP